MSCATDFANDAFASRITTLFPSNASLCAVAAPSPDAPPVAIVTGGASGLGAATAQRLALDGNNVVILDANASLAKSVAQDIGGVALECDVRDASQVGFAIEEAKKLGPVRVAVNCAGVGPPAKILGKEGPHDLDLFRRVIEINLIG